MKIVTARSAHLDEILRLERAVVEAPHWSEAEYRAALSGPQGIVQRSLLIALRDEELLGFAVGRCAADEAELESVAVEASARRLGVGRALCQAMFAWAWQQGSAAVNLEVRASSLGAILLYRGLGFREVGRRPEYYLRPAEDAVLMRLDRETADARTTDRSYLT